MIHTVIKLGGAALGEPALFDRVGAAIGSLARRVSVLVVPGGGPFADAVREADRRFGLTSDQSHWMAVAAMDQSARLVAGRLAGAAVVDSARAASAALSKGRVPVLAPLGWLEEADPLPHSWEATSDSVAAWVAGQVGAGRLVLVKPPGADFGRPEALVDRCFRSFLSSGIEWSVVPAGQPDLTCGDSPSLSARTRSISI